MPQSYLFSEKSNKNLNVFCQQTQKMWLESSQEGKAQRQPAPVQLPQLPPGVTLRWHSITHIKEGANGPNMYPPVWTWLHASIMGLELQGGSCPVKQALPFQEKALKGWSGTQTWVQGIYHMPLSEWEIIDKLSAQHKWTNQASSLQGNITQNSQ